MDMLFIFILFFFNPTGIKYSAVKLPSRTLFSNLFWTLSTASVFSASARGAWQDFGDVIVHKTRQICISIYICEYIIHAYTLAAIALEYYGSDKSIWAAQDRYFQATMYPIAHPQRTHVFHVSTTLPELQHHAVNIPHAHPCDNNISAPYTERSFSSSRISNTHAFS